VSLKLNLILNVDLNISRKAVHKLLEPYKEDEEVKYGYVFIIPGKE